MRKELGKPTRELFFAMVGDVAPEFGRCSAHDIRGFTWWLCRQRGNLRQWLSFQQHRYDNAFTVEISWSSVFEDPTRPPLGTPEDPFTPCGCRMRLGAFWNKGGDFWWHLTDPPPGLLDVSPEEYLQAWAAPSAVDLVTTLPRVRAAVEDAVERIREYAVPYFERVAAWASRQD